MARCILPQWFSLLKKMNKNLPLGNVRIYFVQNALQEQPPLQNGRPAGEKLDYAFHANTVSH